MTLFFLKGLIRLGSFYFLSANECPVVTNLSMENGRHSIGHNGPAIKQVAEGNLPEGRSDRRERSFIACWALLNGA